MHTLSKHKIAPIFSATALVLATVGGSAAGSAPMFDGGRGHGGGLSGFHGSFGGFHRGFGGFRDGFGSEFGGHFGHGSGDRFDRFGRLDRFGRFGRFGNGFAVGPGFVGGYYGWPPGNVYELWCNPYWLAKDPLMC